MTLVLSPHLDDAVFSCGALISALSSHEPITVITCFTQSVADPQGFALECQRDKGLADDVDYMALRRAEDSDAMRLLGADYIWYELPEAPHRGYHSAADLFGGIHPDDTYVAGPLVQRISETLSRTGAEALYYPLGAGNHVDHLQVVVAVDELRKNFPELRYVQYYDQPYANKHPKDYPGLSSFHAMEPKRLNDLGPGDYRYIARQSNLQRKWSACEAYRTQLPFQFGTKERMHSLLGREEYFRLS